MKLFLDQNLSWKLVAELENIFPGTVHVKSVLGINATDRDIWLYAKENGFAIVTKDDDLDRGVCYSVIRQKLFGFGLEIVQPTKL